MHQRDIISEIHNYGIDVKNREIYINEFDDSGESAGVDHRMLQAFIKNINVLKNISKDPITIHMQTGGGCWYSGMGIYDAIKNCKCKTTFIAYGQLCSMGTIIIQSATKRLITPSSIFMCHFGSTDLTGDYLSSQNYAVVERANAQTMLNIYSEKCYKTGAFFKERKYNLSKTKSYIKRKLHSGDWYMNAQDAIEYGFIDGVLK
ncbi:MAG: ATP-dependent Clp protease proteolytic subunit [Candidatus Lokiarchaeota archaeon]|nr:ATP-dependent Clp protease proteolytic subunit [Candidatus Lokiarchaeota archaeon]